MLTPDGTRLISTAAVGLLSKAKNRRPRCALWVDTSLTKGLMVVTAKTDLCGPLPAIFETDSLPARLRHLCQ